MAEPDRPTVKLTVVATSDSNSTRSVDWADLMRRSQEGDRAAYRELLQEITPYLRSIAARCFREISDIEDAVQDTLLTIHSIRGTYDPKRPFGPWLVTIANRRIIDRLRRQTRARAREVALSPEHETFSDPSTNREAQDYQENGALNEALRKLPPDQLEAVRLLKLEERSLREASIATGRSIPSLKTATHRALKRLRMIMNNEGEAK